MEPTILRKLIDKLHEPKSLTEGRFFGFGSDRDVPPDFDEDELDRSIQDSMERDKQAAFKALGLDQSQWEVFEMTWDYCNGKSKWL